MSKTKFARYFFNKNLIGGNWRKNSIEWRGKTVYNGNIRF
nr:MAG TPA: hypothetical protein [Caudoviricetes sp.]